MSNRNARVSSLGTKQDWKRTRRRVGLEFLGSILHAGADFTVHAPMKVAKDSLVQTKRKKR